MSEKKLGDLPFRRQYPICVLTAKTEEAREVVAVFEKAFKPDPRRGIGMQAFLAPSKSEPVPILVSTCNEMGHLAAAVRVVELVTVRQPSFLIFLGTAASLRPDKIQAGDVVIPRKAVNRIYEKISEKGQSDYENRVENADFKELFFDNNALISDTITKHCSADALSAVAGMKISSLKLEEIGEGLYFDGKTSHSYRSCKVFDDIDIFSCGMVIDSVSYRDFLIKLTDSNMRKVGIVDMESYGFFSAIEACRNNSPGTVCEGIMIRGISDYAGRKQQTQQKPEAWKEKSVRNAAIVAAELIRSLVQT